MRCTLNVPPNLSSRLLRTQIFSKKSSQIEIAFIMELFGLSVENEIRKDNFPCVIPWPWDSRSVCCDDCEISRLASPSFAPVSFFTFLSSSINPMHEKYRTLAKFHSNYLWCYFSLPNNFKCSCANFTNRTPASVHQLFRKTRFSSVQVWCWGL